MKMNRSQLHLKTGFTLIELLVVIAIISILASILFPVFARARENARRASCMSNLKQMALGMMMYVQDYDETFPRAHVYLNGSGTATFWWKTIQPYTKSKQLFRCPSSPVAGDLSIDPQNLEYSINFFVAPTPTSTSVVKLSVVQSASTIYMMMDGGGEYVSDSTVLTPGASNGQSSYNPGVGDAGRNCTTHITNSNYLSDCQSGRHFGGENIAFTDGHVKWFKGSDVVQQALNYRAHTKTNNAWNPASNN